MTTSRVKRFAPLAWGVVLWLVLGVVHLLHQNAAPFSQPVPAFHKVVLLIVPGLNADDWGSENNMPAFVHFGGPPTALFPVPARLHRPQSDILSPDDRLGLACQMLLGKKRLPMKVLDSSGGAVANSFGDRGTSVVFLPNTWSIAAPEAVGGQVTDPVRFTQTILAALGTPDTADASRPIPSPPVLVAAVLDDLYRADTYAPFCLPEAAQQQRQNALRRINQVLATLTQRAPGGDPFPDAVLLVAPLPSASQSAEKERMGFLLLWNPADQKGAHLLLTSPSTRHTPGFAAFDDIPPTLFGMLGLPTRANGSGRALETVIVRQSPLWFAEQTKHWAAQWRETRLLVAIPWILAALLGASVWGAESQKHNRLRWFCALVACLLPAALWATALFPLLTGERFGGGFPYYALTALFCVGTAAIPVWRKTNKASALQAIAGGTALLFALDTVLGGPLLSRSPLSYSPLEGARFYGVGNEASGVFLGASLVFALMCGTKPSGFGARLLFGLGVAALLGLPTLGADAGGAIAALAGWGTLLVLEVSPQKRKGAALLAILCAVLLLAGLAGWESRRPPNAQTHLGRVITQTQTGGISGAVTIARRKIAMNAHLVVSSPWAVLLFVKAGLCIYLWRKAKTSGTTINKGGAIALFVGAGAAFIANDSGVVMAATCLLFAPPFLLFTPVKQIE